MAMKETNFNWEEMKTEDQKIHQKKEPEPKKPQGKGEIQFKGGRPQFNKSSNIGKNKSDFPELDDKKKGKKEEDRNQYSYGASEKQKE